MTTKEKILFEHIRNVLYKFAKMDREGCDLDELACERGAASDKTCIFSGDFRDARLALIMLEEYLKEHIQKSALTNP